MASKKKITLRDLLKKGYSYALAIGFMAAIAMGWNGKGLETIENYFENAKFFPKSGYLQEVEDGDTFTLKSGIKVRLLGINSPDRGQKGFSEAMKELTDEISGKKVFLEYDRYQGDKYGRILAWVWVDCEKTPKFLPADYMHKSQSESNAGLMENPKDCKKGKLINEELVKSKFAVPVVYKDRGPLKYESRLTSLSPQSP